MELGAGFEEDRGFGRRRRRRYGVRPGGYSEACGYGGHFMGL